MTLTNSIIITYTTKSALHRTRLRFSNHKNFSVFFFYKPTCQPAQLLGLCIPMPTEIIEKNFSFFQFCHFLSVQKTAKNYAISLNLKTRYYFTWRGKKSDEKRNTPQFRQSLAGRGLQMSRGVGVTEKHEQPDTKKPNW
ncbi:hypothetical protein [Pectobacterium carotovorum]|uniref:hypothetical protein n=1 Tax=Pectobacterium carotovorum TaxID=554 RepID=UPI0037F86EC2